MKTMLAMIVVCLACGPKAGVAPGPLSPVEVEAARAQWPSVSSTSLEHGRELFLGNCNRCHDYPDRIAYPADKWPGVVHRMGEKAKLSSADTELVLRFVLADRQADLVARRP